MSKEQGFVRLMKEGAKEPMTAGVLLLQAGQQYLICPVWKDTPNKLVPIMFDKEKGQFYVDATDPFAYELFEAKDFDGRINEFNELAMKRELGVKIAGILTDDDLTRAGIPHCVTGNTDCPVITLYE